MRFAFLAAEDQSLDTERPLSERIQLAQSMTLLAELFELVGQV